MARRNKKKGRIAGLIAGGITFAGVSKIVGWIPFIGFILSAAAGAIVGSVVSIMAGGLDTTTHNKEDIERQQREEAARKAAEAEQAELEARRRAVIEARQQEEARKAAAAAAEARKNEIPLTGNELADSVITRGQEMLRQIREVNAAIPDKELTEEMDSLESHCRQIFRTVSEKPDSAVQVRKFMNYYLPTTLKMLTTYRKMLERGVSKEETDKVYYDLTYALKMVDGACAKQLDSLYKDNMLDISTDIEVLEQMLRRDGLTEGSDSAPVLKTKKPAAATAAAQMLRQKETTVMEEPKTTAKPDMDIPDNSNRTSNIHL